MNHILQMLSKLLKGSNRPSRSDCTLTSSIGNDDELDESEQAITVYNEFIDKLQLDIPKDVDYRLNIYSYFGVQKKPNDTVLIDMMIKVFHIKRFDSELFVFLSKGKIINLLIQ